MAVECVALISATAEWDVIRECYPAARCTPSPYGDCFDVDMRIGKEAETVVFLHGGWGKVAAAGSTQYAIGRWMPKSIVNLGTCGGFEGAVQPGEVILAERTVIYDIEEQMGDAAMAIDHFTTEFDLSRLPDALPHPVRRSVLLSADRDILVGDVALLQERFGALAADWESGAIGHVAARHDVPCLILRVVTDLVGGSGGEAYGDMALFRARARTLLPALVDALPQWVALSRTVGVSSTCRQGGPGR